MTDAHRVTDTHASRAAGDDGLALPCLLPLDLLSIIETQIIPRLVEAYATPARSDDGHRHRVAAFTRTILEDGLDEAHAQAEAMLATGVTLDALFLDVFTPTAVALGDLWAADDLSFADVTLASYKLHRLVRAFGALHAKPGVPGKGRILLAPLPTNKHTLGVLIVEEFFQRAGWTVLSLPASSGLEIVSSVHREWFDVIGLSLSCDQGADLLPELIASLRRASLNPAIVVLVGGAYFDADPERALRMGADARAGDAIHAVAQGSRLIAEQAAR